MSDEPEVPEEETVTPEEETPSPQEHSGGTNPPCDPGKQICP